MEFTTKYAKSLVKFWLALFNIRNLNGLKIKKKYDNGKLIYLQKFINDKNNRIA